MSLIEQVIMKINQTMFEKTCSKIRHTPPLEYKPDPGITIVSMVSHSTVNMYLVAVKSFMTNFSDATIEAIDDGSLTEDDKNILRNHIPGIDITNSDDINTGSCPDYISWKRLFRIIELTNYSYTIQLDSDTITLAPLIEVYDKVKSNSGFMIADGRWQELVDVDFLHAIAKRWTHIHPQALAEREYHTMEYFKETRKYLHGCAGFAGYPKGSLSEEKVHNLSQEIEGRIGKGVWRKWGSEQTATNCLISKTKNASVLPWPKYNNYLFPPSNVHYESSSLIHFIGTNRFIDSTYRKAVNKFFDRLENKSR